jgi:hypothetical protein
MWLIGGLQSPWTTTWSFPVYPSPLPRRNYECGVMMTNLGLKKYIGLVKQCQ